jgi:HlyD family secretion protein
MVPVTLLTMVDDSARRVRALVDEGEISKVCLQQPVRITADGVPGKQMDGTVENISATVIANPFADNASRQFRQVMISVSGDADWFAGIGAILTLCLRGERYCKVVPRPPAFSIGGD